MPNTIKISKFTGMNNKKDSEQFFVDEGVAEPRIILNSDVTKEGRLVKREGQTKIISLTDGHSLSRDLTLCLLVMDGTTLKRIEGETATTIEDIGGQRTPTYYAEVGSKVYISNKYYTGIFDPDTDTLSAWGITLPVGPVLSSTTGGLPIGTYHVCFTQTSGDDMSGNGPISQIVLTSEGGISISNRPSGAVVWCTDPNGDQFFEVGKTDTIVKSVSVEPLPTLFCSPPPFMECLTYAFGRFWGFVDDTLYYSESLHNDRFRLGLNRIKFDSKGTLIAKVWSGLFVGCEDRTYFMAGTDPAKEMVQKDIGTGSRRGSLGYGNGIIELGDTISPPEKKHQNVPVWVTQDGIVAGNPMGRLFSLSQRKVKFSPGAIGATLVRMKDGSFQILTSFPRGGVDSGLGMGDDATCEVIRDGVVI